MGTEVNKDHVAELVGEIEEVTDDISDIRWMDAPVLIVFAALFFIVALQFFTRYVLNNSLGWTEEIARYFLILLGFVGGVTAVREGKHIFLEFMFHYLPRWSMKPLVVATELIVTGFWGYLGWLAVELAQRTHSNMVSITLPKAYLYYAVAASCVLMSILSLFNLWRELNKSADQLAREKLEFHL